MPVWSSYLDHDCHCCIPLQRQRHLYTGTRRLLVVKHAFALKDLQGTAGSLFAQGMHRASEDATSASTLLPVMHPLAIAKVFTSPVLVHALNTAFRYVGKDVTN